jgi:hypothetical protein
VEATYSIQNLTVLINQEFGNFSTVVCPLYDSNQQALMSGKVVKGKEVPHRVILQSAYFKESGILPKFARETANKSLEEIKANPNGVRFAVGKTIDQCYYFSPKDLDALKQLKSEEISQFFDERYRDVTQNIGRTRTWEEACERKVAVAPLSSQDEIPHPARDKQKSSATWKPIAAALTATSLGVALLYFNRTSIQSWLKG